MLVTVELRVGAGVALAGTSTRLSWRRQRQSLAARSLAAMPPRVAAPPRRLPWLRRFVRR